MTMVTDTPTRTVEAAGVHHLRAGGVSVVLDCRGPALPSVLHWGADLGELDERDLAALVLASGAAVVASRPDRLEPITVVPQQALGWSGQPGLSGHRSGRTWSPLFTLTDVLHQGSRCLRVLGTDAAAALDIALELSLDVSGLLTLAAEVTNTGADDYTVDGLVLALPVPGQATELLDLTGRHCRERVPQRSPFTIGTRLRDSRRGRTGADATLLLMAGEAGFGFRAGEVWGLHVGWSGNHRTYAERTPHGEQLLGGGELLWSGEVILQPGGSYRSPVLYAAYGDGLDAMSARFHRYLRGRAQHPRAARPVVANTWEAVYFDHDFDRLRDLADRAAAVGVERFVLDDGWFLRRRDDSAGLGDWYVDEDVWPQGLHPLVDHVRSLGMEFGLWFEPEMVNPDSQLARAHPEWVLATGDRLPPESRHQQVLNLAHPDAYRYLFERIDALVGEYGVAYLKWDHNRDLIDAGDQTREGRAGVHAQTHAFYRLIDDLKSAHPDLEIESCSSGGARVDLGVLQRTDRVWPSDCIDALERQQIQRWTELLVPPELLGAHVGSGHSHTTGRSHRLDFRAGTALFGHLGIEWDLTEATPEESEELAAWIAAYRRLRGLLHTGDVVRADHPDPATWVHGVVSAERDHAVFAVVAMATSDRFPLGRVAIPGLDGSATYRVRPLAPGHRPGSNDRTGPTWLADGELVCSGALLGTVGLQMPAIHPEQQLLLEIERI